MEQELKELLKTNLKVQLKVTMDCLLCDNNDSQRIKAIVSWNDEVITESEEEFIWIPSY